MVMLMNGEPAGCHVEDDGFPSGEILAVEAADPRGHRQSLRVRVGPAWYGDEETGPVVWVSYQEEHMAGPLAGPVLLTPQAWRELAQAVGWRLDEERENTGYYKGNDDTPTSKADR